MGAKRAAKGVAWIAAAIVVSSLRADAPKPMQHPELERARREIREMKLRLEGVRVQTRSAQQQLEAINLQVGITTRELELAVIHRQDVDARRQAIELQTGQLERKISHDQLRISARLRQLYRLGGMSYFRLLLSIETDRNPFEVIGMLSYLVRRDASDIDRFRNSQAQLSARRGELAREEAQVSLALTDVTRRQQAFDQARAAQQQLLSGLQLESATSTQKLAELEEKARRLERLLRLLSQKPTAIDPAVPIARYKGSLDWPLRGAVVVDFGRHRSEHFATYTVSNGIRIAAPVNAEVHAVFPGTVLYAQWFKGYGNLVIVDHGGRVFTLYGNTRIGLARAGDRVTAGQTIATVNVTETGETDAALYFEVRENNHPVNPRGWLKP